MSTVTEWFPDKKELMTGIVAMGFGLGAFILSVVLAPILMYCSTGAWPLYSQPSAPSSARPPSAPLRC